MAARAYNTYGASTLSYVGQLEAFPAMAGAAERRALSLAAQGPGDSWRRNNGFEDLFVLKESWGMPHSFRSLALQTQAAQLRVALCENWQAAGGDWRQRAESFQAM